MGTTTSFSRWVGRMQQNIKNFPMGETLYRLAWVLGDRKKIRSGCKKPGPEIPEKSEK